MVLGTTHKDSAKESFFVFLLKEMAMDTLFELESNVVYSRARGYWTSAPVGVKGTVLRLIPRSLWKRPLELTMDIYKPSGSTSSKRPLLLMMHGGSFYIGNKEEAGQAEWCRQFASKGYVTASINYRLGFLPAKRAFRKAEQRALDDARAAVNYLTGREDLDIDSGKVFAAGTSSGAMLALGLAYGGQPGPDWPRIRAIGAFWGALTDLEALDGGNVPILSFQSVNDPVMPYTKDYPFAGRLGRFKYVMALFTDKMYGTFSIHQRALEIGIDSEHHPCAETGHRLHIDKDGLFTPRFYEMRDAMAAFFK